jgi:hypothetical protein
MVFRPGDFFARQYATARTREDSPPSGVVASTSCRRGSNVPTQSTADVRLLARLADEATQMMTRLNAFYQQEAGAMGYILLWAMGVPASLLFLVFLLRGCN